MFKGYYKINVLTPEHIYADGKSKKIFVNLLSL